MEQKWLYGIIGLLAGSLMTVVVASNAVNTNNTGMMQMMGMREMMAGQEMMSQAGDHGVMGMGSSMEEMMESMKGKSGDELDKAFMTAMMPHHQGAIAMAKAIGNTAYHQELRLMAKDIIEAQTKEIEMMQGWMKQWGYQIDKETGVG